jgi:hypothetical protein
LIVIYEDYLREIGSPLFNCGGIQWRPYLGSLIPASTIPTFIDINKAEKKELLTKSKAFLIRYSSKPSNQETPWWWIVCDEYDIAKVSRNTRNQIKRGYKKCSVHRISARYLAEFGYECYRNAFRRYNNVKYMKCNEFKEKILQLIGYENIFEHWGVFIKNKLVGYVECIIESEKGVSTSVIKYDPDYLVYYSSYAMMDTLLSYYVNKKGLPLSNGNRSISHDTNIQDFLLKFGFNRKYCHLNIHYRRSIKLAIQLMYPLRKKIRLSKKMNKLSTILFQEELRKACNQIPPINY